MDTLISSSFSYNRPKIFQYKNYVHFPTSIFVYLIRSKFFYSWWPKAAKKSNRHDLIGCIGWVCGEDDGLILAEHILKRRERTLTMTKHISI